MKTALQVIFISFAISLVADTTLTYTVSGEKETKEHSVSLSVVGGENRFFTEGEKGGVEIICNQAMETIRYMVLSTEDGYSMTAELTDGGINVDKTADGKTESVFLEYDGSLPWYQTFNYQFSDFALSGEKKRDFVMIRPDNLTLTEWKLIRKGVEIIETPMGEIRTVKVKVTLAGFLSAFWSAECWFRADDGRFVKYAGPDGGPGSPDIVSVLSGEKQG